MIVTSLFDRAAAHARFARQARMHLAMVRNGTTVHGWSAPELKRAIRKHEAAVRRDADFAIADNAWRQSLAGK